MKSLKTQWKDYQTGTRRLITSAPTVFVGYTSKLKDYSKDTSNKKKKNNLQQHY